MNAKWEIEMLVGVWGECLWWQLGLVEVLVEVGDKRLLLGWALACTHWGALCGVVELGAIDCLSFC